MRIVPQIQGTKSYLFYSQASAWQGSKVSLSRLPSLCCPYTPGVYAAWTGGARGFLPCSGCCLCPSQPHDESWPSVSCGACWSFQGRLASAPSWAVRVLQWTMTSRGLVPQIVTPWACCGSTAPGMQPLYKPNLYCLLIFCMDRSSFLDDE